MSRIQIHKNSFTGGEISTNLLGRGDLRAYDNGMMKLRNVFIHPTGGVSRRSGLRLIDAARGNGRLVAFEFNTEQVYLLAFSDQHIDVYRDGVKVADFTAPWSLQQVGQISWIQSADTLFIVHPDTAPKKITRLSDAGWSILDWEFFEKNGKIFQPHHKFADDAVTLTPSATTGSITITASRNVFQTGHAGKRLRLENKEVAVTSYVSATQVQAAVKETLLSTAAVKDWEEQSFSDLRGWPATVSFHQDRLVIGGSRDLPNRLWLSKSSDLFNFDLGAGLDDESIEFAILSDQVNAIRAVFSSRHLQVFTSGSEWKVAGEPITPGSVQLHRQTRIGSPVDRTVPPRDVDGATLFIPRSGAELREFLYYDGEQAYQSTDLAMLAQHMIDDPVDQDFQKSRRLHHLVMRNGSLATLTIYRAEEVNAWCLQETAGSIKSVVAIGEDCYVLVERAGGFYVEIFDPAFNVDSGLGGTDVNGKTIWSGLNHLEGATVKILADGAVRPDKVVANGAVELAEPAFAVQIGLGFSHVIEPLPPAAQPGGGDAQGGKLRPVEITFRLHDSSALRLDAGSGFIDVPFKRFGENVLDAPPQAFTGDKAVRVLGWKKDAVESIWRIQQDAPLPFTLLAVMTEIKLNV
ncbi:MAG: hypothetical protein A3G18_10375 [Rhodospirillales bacterium RIFCSPLOWO2_12_FULL_58_28]|nr:MAG: hypothetical protein A3H92_08550 [Rhodospirillales bacterium RIFCSPLOWO2_02_FULL_58_16]OHC77681.1 MAG: hypothetical protein A3G18_10375 [Rhodospirillales bacterium RIFCSPLOWO2_12_FULL_58_28]